MIGMKFLTAALALRVLGTGVGAVARDPDPEDPKPAIVEALNDLPMPCRAGAVCVASLTQPQGDGWQAELVVHFTRRSVRGNILVLVYDAADKQAIARREVTRLWNIEADPLHNLQMVMPFDRDAGFHKNHTYKVKVVQLLRKHEVVLAEGSVHLE